MNPMLLQTLCTGAKALELALSDDTAKRLLDFLALLQKWNSAYNLTAINSLDNMVTHHLLDSLAVVPFLHGKRILDVGTGAGFPGVPLAIYDPTKHVVLLDSNGKKVRFLLQAKSVLPLVNVSCQQSRMQAFVAEQPFDVITCRALGEITTTIAATEHLMASNGRWVFMKGTVPQAELDVLSYAYSCHRVEIPGLDAERHIIVVSPS